MGCLIDSGRLMDALAALNCDKDADDRFCVDGLIVSFMGANQEYCIGEDAVFYRDGKPEKLAEVLTARGAGLNVRVI